MTVMCMYFPGVGSMFVTHNKQNVPYFFAANFVQSELFSGFQMNACSDITNTLVGISEETVPEGGNLRIY